jgi:hypothetical protein
MRISSDFYFYLKIRQDNQIFDCYALSPYTPSYYAHAQCAHIVTLRYLSVSILLLRVSSV